MEPLPLGDGFGACLCSSPCFPVFSSASSSSSFSLGKGLERHTQVEERQGLCCKRTEQWKSVLRSEVWACIVLCRGRISQCQNNGWCVFSSLRSILWDQEDHKNNRICSGFWCVASKFWAQLMFLFLQNVEISKKNPNVNQMALQFGFFSQPTVS